jgi:hypothetical protein
VLSDALGMDVDLPAPDEEMDEFAPTVLGV